jgi:hypothetical protein
MNRKNIILNVFRYFKLRSGPGGRKKGLNLVLDPLAAKECASPQCGFFVLF